jgi:hypothetical protein
MYDHGEVVLELGNMPREVSLLRPTNVSYLVHSAMAVESCVEFFVMRCS